MSKDRRYDRLGLRYGKLVVLITLSASVLALGILGIWYLFSGSSGQMTILLAADPVTLARFNQPDHKLTIISFPGNANIIGTRGTGLYSLASLWRLGKIDPRDRGLLAESITQTTAIPIGRYLEFKDANLPTFTDSLSLIKKTFSVANIASFLSGKYSSNLTLPEFISLTREVMGLRPDYINLIEISERSALDRLDQADGTKLVSVNADKLEHLISSSFVDDKLRSEGLRVAIFNTTATPELGVRAERLLVHAGILVVTVDNDPVLVKQCVVTGTRKKIQSLTAKFISQSFGCTLIESEEITRSDLTLKLGTDYEEIFLPRK